MTGRSDCPCLKDMVNIAFKSDITTCRDLRKLIYSRNKVLGLKKERIPIKERELHATRISTGFFRRQFDFRYDGMEPGVPMKKLNDTNELVRDLAELRLPYVSLSTTVSQCLEV